MSGSSTRSSKECDSLTLILHITRPNSPLLLTQQIYSSGLQNPEYERGTGEANTIIAQNQLAGGHAERRVHVVKCVGQSILSVVFPNQSTDRRDRFRVLGLHRRSGPHSLGPQVIRVRSKIVLLQIVMPGQVKHHSLVRLIWEQHSCMAAMTRAANDHCKRIGIRLVRLPVLSLKPSHAESFKPGKEPF